MPHFQMRYHHSCLILSDLVFPSPSLFKVGLAEINGPKKEIYNVTAIWLRLIATTHQEDVAQVTMLIQQWFNLFGRWPITIAFFVAAAPREAKDRYSGGRAGGREGGSVRGCDVVQGVFDGFGEDSLCAAYDPGVLGGESI